jgi:methylated-DNA-[protein]-cysteine S-methyltransferase
METEALIATPFGFDLFVAAGDAGVSASRFVRRSPRAGAPVRGRRHPVLGTALARLEAYFGRRPPRFDVPLDLTGTPFEVAVWQATAALPYGIAVSYADVARSIGRPNAARGVARALSRTPLALFVPAHRVIGADGTLKGAGPGSLRRRLLAFEGIRIQ